MLSVVPFEIQVEDTTRAVVADEVEINPPEYASVDLEVTEPVRVNNVARWQPPLNSFGQAGTKELIARLAATNTVANAAARPPKP